MRAATARLRPLVVVCLNLFFGVTLSQGTSAPSVDRAEMPSTVRAVAASSAAAIGHQAYVVRPLTSTEQATGSLDVELALPLRNFDDLRRRLDRGERISREEMALKYFPIEADYRVVVDWVMAVGLSFTTDDTARMSVFVQGTPQQLSMAFQTEFARVSCEDTEFTSAITVPSLPSGVAARVLAVNGLQPHLRMKRLGQAPRVAAASAGYMPAQIAAGYSLSATATGAGETIAIMIDGYPDASDYLAFWSVAGVNRLASSVTRVSVSGGPATVDEISIMEATLDVEWSGALAPAAAIRIYGIPALGSSGINAACAQIYTDAQTVTGLHQLSMSFGGAESSLASSSTQAMNQRFAVLASAGISVLASSGDGGSNPSADTGDYSPTAPLVVIYPASDPYVAGIGGTSLVLGSAGNTVSETAWSNSGGGYSQLFPRPDWQQPVALGSASDGHRLVPDISAAADINYGGYLYYKGKSYTVGGTSWSCPIWAAFTAALNGTRRSHGLPALGNLGPVIYPLMGSASFRDITSGSNGAYSARAGYDLCTGIGAPVMSELLVALSGSAIIKTSPQTVECDVDSSASFTVTAGGSGTIGYQWQRLPAGSSTWQDIASSSPYAGATDATLTIPATTLAMDGDQFRCAVANTIGSATSSAAALLVCEQWTVTTYAGKIGESGSVDGPVSVARFYQPQAVAADDAGNVYVYDPYSSKPYRKISAAGVVSTLAANADPEAGHASTVVYPVTTAVDSLGYTYVASVDDIVTRTARDGAVTVFGKFGTSGRVDGTADVVRFSRPTAVAAVPGGGVYVGDGSRIRQIKPEGTVTTIAGNGEYGLVDGLALGATFTNVTSLAVDPSGVLFALDNGHIRRITPGGAVTTIAGGAGGSTVPDGTGTEAYLHFSGGLGFDRNGNLFVADSGNFLIRKASVVRAPMTLLAPADQSATLDQNIPFTVVVGGLPAITYSWQELAANGTQWRTLSEGGIYTGTGTKTLVVHQPGLGSGGNQYRCSYSNRYGSGTSAAAKLTVAERFWINVAATTPTPSWAFDYMLGVAVGADGTVYVADGGNHTISRLNADGSLTVIAGTAGVSGFTNGQGAAARFNLPLALAVAADGSIYVADHYNAAIRRVTPQGAVTTFAGGHLGAADGTGTAAAFNGPYGLAFDRSQNLYAVELGNHTIRKITPAGVVTTFAGAAGQSGLVDGTGTAARFFMPAGIALDVDGTLIVADSANAVLRRITPAGVVSTVAGIFGTAGWMTNVIGNGPSGIAIDPAGNYYVSVATGHVIQMRTPSGGISTVVGAGISYGRIDGPGNLVGLTASRSIATSGSDTIYYTDGQSVLRGTLVSNQLGMSTLPATTTATLGGAVTLTALAGNFTYQWQRNGVDLAGATNSTLTLSGLTATQAGSYRVVLAVGTAKVTSTATNLAVASNSWLSNLSARAYVAPSLNPDNVLIAGFVSQGDDQKTMIVRAVGPTLIKYGVANGLAHPRLKIFDDGNLVVTATSWDNSLAEAFTSVGAFPLQANSGDAAVRWRSRPASYSAMVEPIDGQDGVALLELYDADTGAPGRRLINVSIRAYTSSGDNVAIGGFSISGTTSRTVLIRGVGPTLVGWGIGNSLRKPVLSLYDGAQPARLIATNTGWTNASARGPSPVAATLEPATTALMANCGAFALQPASADSAMVVTLPPGGYSAQVSSPTGSGVALIEIYEVK